MFGHEEQDHDDNNQPHDDHKPAEDIVQPSDTSSDDSWQHPGPPPSDDDNGDHGDHAGSNDSEDNKPSGFSLENHGSDDNDSDDNATEDSHASDRPVVDNDLIDLKQEALTKLSPLVGHIDQNPEEKFRTLMMMIQASDDQSLVRQAYETALKIDGEKERAQALLDIVNEINYFTQNPKQQ
jgi:hypothetical protein